MVDDNVYEVERILAQRSTDQGERYLIKWQGYGQEECTWEPFANFNTQEVLRQWEHQKAINDVLEPEDLERIQRQMDAFQSTSPRATPASKDDDEDYEASEDDSSINTSSNTDHSNIEEISSELTKQAPLSYRKVASKAASSDVAKKRTQSPHAEVRISNNASGKLGSALKGREKQPRNRSGEPDDSPIHIPDSSTTLSKPNSGSTNISNAQFFAPDLSQPLRSKVRARRTETSKKPTTPTQPGIRIIRPFRSEGHMNYARKKLGEDRPALPKDTMELDESNSDHQLGSKFSARQPTKNKSYLFFDESDDAENESDRLTSDSVPGNNTYNLPEKMCNEEAVTESQTSVLQHNPVQNALREEQNMRDLATIPKQNGETADHEQPAPMQPVLADVSSSTQRKTSSIYFEEDPSINYMTSVDSVELPFGKTRPRNHIVLEISAFSHIPAVKWLHIPPKHADPILKLKGRLSKPDARLRLTFDHFVQRQDYERLSRSRFVIHLAQGPIEPYKDTAPKLESIRQALEQRNACGMWYHPTEDLMVVVYSVNSTSWRDMPLKPGHDNERPSLHMLLRQKFGGGNTMDLDLILQRAGIETKYPGNGRSSFNTGNVRAENPKAPEFYKLPSHQCPPGQLPQQNPLIDQRTPQSRPPGPRSPSIDSPKVVQSISLSSRSPTHGAHVSETMVHGIPLQSIQHSVSASVSAKVQNRIDHAERPRSELKFDRPISHLAWDKSGTFSHGQLCVLVAYENGQISSTRIKQIQHVLGQQCHTADQITVTNDLKVIASFCAKFRNQRPAAIVFSKDYPIALLPKEFTKLVNDNENVICWEADFQHSDTIPLNLTLPHGTVYMYLESSYLERPKETTYLLKTLRNRVRRNKYSSSKLVLPPNILITLLDKMIVARNTHDRGQYKELITVLNELESIASEQYRPILSTMDEMGNWEACQMTNEDVANDKHEVATTDASPLSRSYLGFDVLKPSWAEVYRTLSTNDEKLNAQGQLDRDQKKDEFMIEYLASWAILHLREHRRFQVYLTYSPKSQAPPAACGHVRIQMLEPVYQKAVTENSKNSAASKSARGGVSAGTTPKTPKTPKTPHEDKTPNVAVTPTWR